MTALGKTCRKCGADNWYLEPKKEPSGYQPKKCRECAKRYVQGPYRERARANRAAWRAANPEKILERRQRYSREKPEHFLWVNARARSKRDDIVFTITREDIKAVWPPDNRCPVLGIDLVWGHGKGHSHASASLDRLVPELGYVPGNIAVISHRANAIKSDASLEEVRRVADWMARQIPAN